MPCKFLTTFLPALKEVLGVPLTRNGRGGTQKRLKIGEEVYRDAGLRRTQPTRLGKLGEM